MKSLFQKFTVQRIIIFTFVVVVLFLGSQFLELGGSVEQRVVNKPCIPTFPDGDGPYYQLNAPTRTKISPNYTDGTKLFVKGKVFKRDCITPVNDVVLDIWHADPTGTYQPEWYRGKVKVTADGSYEFETNMPKGYGEGTGYRPPHIHFKVESGSRVLITSEMFFPDVRGKEGFNDAYIVQLELINTLTEKYFEAYHDIILP